MKKQILLLSAVLAALPALAARADDWTDITTALTVPVDTAEAANGVPGDIKLDEGGSITVQIGGPAVTINSNNSFFQVNGTTISNKDTDQAVGILVDLTEQSLDATNAGCPPDTPDCHTTEGIIVNGTVDLTGTGKTKRGLWLKGPTTDSGLGPFSFTGNIDMSASTLKIAGDSSIGVLIDQLTILNGNLTLGSMQIQPTSVTGSTVGVIGFENDGVINGDVDLGIVNDNMNTVSVIQLVGSTNQTASGTVGMLLGGTINGNVLIGQGSQLIAYGTGAQGLILTGNLNPLCVNGDPTLCTSLGHILNQGLIKTAGTPTPGTKLTGNPTSGVALGIGGNVPDGIMNNGPTSTNDAVAAATISAESFAPVVEISPSLQNVLAPTPLTVGIYTEDTVDPGFSFYNRGAILATSSNVNQSTSAMFIVGDTGAAPVTLTGGIFNSGTISATVVTNDTATSASTASALSIGADASIGPADTYSYDSTCDCMVYSGGLGGVNAKIFGDQAALVVSNAAGAGKILASITGPVSNNSAIAISIADGAVLPSIINSGVIQATATSSDTTISGLSAVAIRDASGTLTYIQNNGAIQALVSKLDDDSQQNIAIDLSLDQGSSPAGDGVEILNQATDSQSATIVGDIKFGEGDHQIVDVFGNSTDNVATITGDIHYGGGGIFGSDELNIGNFATVTGAITADNGLSVDVQNGGTLVLTNDGTALSAERFHIEAGGTLDLTVMEDFQSGIVDATQNTDGSGTVIMDAGAKLNITYGSFVPEDSQFVLFTAPNGQLSISDTAIYNAQLAQDLPYLFKSAVLSQIENPDTTESYILTVDVKTADELGLTGYASQMLPYANQALINDNPLGAAMVGGITDQKSAQIAYAAFAPNVTGGTRAIAMSLTDQATGPVASRQRILRMYGKESGEVTLWGQEFAEYIKDPGKISTGQTGFKDHGFGFVLGLDGGDPKIGWYGGALTFYSGDIVEPAPRNSHANTLWYMLTAYTDWRGRGLFLDTKLDVGYLDIKGKRYIDLTIPDPNGGPPTHFVDEADNHHPGLVGSAGFTTGVILAYGATTFTPQLSVDGMTLREEGYAESHPTTAPGNGKGFDLTTNSYYANSLRVFLGADVREDLDLGDFFLQPDVRVGYRYDFLNDPTKVTAHFSNIASTGVLPGPNFTIVGPDPAQGNFVAGASLSATTDAWTLGANFDFVRGTNGVTTEVGTIHLLGRI